MKHERFIVTSMSPDAVGFYGQGETLEIATKRWYRAGGRLKHRQIERLRFSSDLPFAPSDRDARDDEADAWCNGPQYNWIRCTVDKVDRAGMPTE